jgi:hypothetical protein
VSHTSLLSSAVVTPEAVDPAHNQRIPGAEHIEQPPSLLPILELGANPAHALIRDDFVDCEAGSLGLASLVIPSRTNHRCPPPSPLRVSSNVGRILARQ